MSNKVKTLFENKDGTELKEWLDGKTKIAGEMKTNRELIKNKRILYVIRPNIDKSLIKFGIGGVEHGGSSAYGRLLQYVNYYGESGEFDCLGVKLFLIVANEYNPNVEGKNSAIFRKEKFLKAQLNGDTLSGRGTERVKTNIRKLFGLIFQTSNKTDEDIEIERRKSERLEQSNITKDDKVTKVTDHVTPTTGTGKTVYRTHWNRPYILTEKIKDKNGKVKTKETKVFETDETYKTLVTVRDGKEKVDEYINKHPRARFVN